MSRRKLLLETLEDRILCSATAPVAAEAAPKDHATAVITADPNVTIAAAAPTGLQHAPVNAATAAGGDAEAAALTDEQRQAIEDVIRDSTAEIWFEENVGQFPEGVRYGFKTTFGAMLVYDDHLRILTTQNDPATGEQAGIHTVDIHFTGGNAWQFARGGASGVPGSYQQEDGTSLTPESFKELTLRNVYDGVDLRLYSADQGILEFDWLIARPEDYQKIRMQVSGQDGLIFHEDGSATIDLRYEDLRMKLPEVYQVIGGEKHLLGAAMVAGGTEGEIRYRVDGELAPDAPLVIDPNVAWATWFDLNNIGGTFDAYLFAVAANSNGVYVFGYSNTTITDATHGAYMEGNAGFSQGTANNQAYIYRLNGTGTNITAWTSTGIVTNNSVSNQTTPEQAADLELFPDGRVLAGFTSGRVQIFSADLATRSYDGEPVTLDSLNSLAIVDNNSFYVGGRVTAAIPTGQIAAANIGPDATFAGSYEGVIIRYSNATATPTPNWATYVGGNNSEYFTGIALTPDKTKLVFATTTVVGSAYPALVNAIDSTPGAAGTTEVLVGVLPEQATKPAAFSVFSYLGGTGNEGTVGTGTAAAVVTATNSFFYVAGSTASTNLPGVTAASGGVTNGGQVAFGGGAWDAFASRISVSGSAGGGFQSTYLGGNAEDRIGGIAYDTLADRLLVFGSTAGGTFPVLNTSPASNYYQGTYGGSAWDIFTVTFTGNLATKEFASFIGGSRNDYLGQTGTLLGQGHVIYSADTGLTYLATTAHSADIPASAIGTPPGKDTTKSNGTNDTHIVFAFNLNIFDYGDAPLTYDVSAASAGREGLSSTLRLGALVDAEATPASGVTATGDDLLNSGTGDDEDALAAIPVLNVGDTSYALDVSVFNNSGAARTLDGWIDFNRNGTFEAGERATVSVPNSALQQNVTLIWASVPALTAGQSYIRLRISDTVLADNAGTPAIDERSIGTGNFGEIEDHALTIAAQPTLQVGNVTATEGTDTHAVFAVSLSNVGTTAVSFNLALAGVTASGGGTDYGTGGAGNLQVSTDGGGSWADATSATIAAGTLSVLVRTPIVNDLLDEAAETFTLTATRTAGNTTNASAVGTATIVDNDPAPALSINNVTVNEAAGTATFTVTLNTASGQAVSVNYATSNGTATTGADFTATSGTLNFAPGVVSQTISVPILNDTIFEVSEAFNVTLSGAVNATIATGTGIGTIRDDGTGAGGTDDDTPTLSVSSPTVTEGADPYANFTVSLSNPSAQPISGGLSLTGITATGGAVDFGPGLEVSIDGGSTWGSTTTGTLPPGMTSILVRTPVIDDLLDEAAETFTLTATRSAGVTTNASASGTATIIDNDPTPALTIDDVTVNEAAGTATFTVTLSAPSGQSVSVNYATSDGTATAGADYTAASGTLNFAPGVVTRTITVPILDDATFESSETFNVSLSGAVNATIADALGIGTIKDDGTGPGGTDDDTPTLGVSSPAVTEGSDAFAVFTVSLSNPSTTPVTFNLALADVTASGGGTDYGTGGAGNLQVSTDGGGTWVDAGSATIAAGATSVLVRAPIIDDALDEPAETFTLTVTRTAGTTTNASASGTATIADDDATPSLTIDDVTVNEGAGTATFTVTLSAASGQSVNVNYATSSGTATAGADFTSTSGTLTFAPGVTTQTITVAIANDGTYEGSESFNTTLSGAVNATIADALGLGTIKDDGTGAGGGDDDTPTLVITNPSVTEGLDGFATFTVSLSNPSVTPVSLNLALANVTASGGGTDYGTAGAGNLQVSTDGGATWADASTATFAAGATSLLVRTPIADDALDEAAETFTLLALRTAGATTNASTTGTATIVDDDPTPSLVINDVTVNEGAGTATFAVTLSAPSGQAVSVNYATNNGTATAGADFAAAAGTLNFAPGVTTRTITVPIFNDAVFENSETFTVLLSTPVNATIADNTGLGTIRDDGTGGGGADNDTPTLTVSNVTATEGTDTHAVFTVGLSNASTTAVVVNLALANGTAVGGGTDFGPAIEVSTDGGATWAPAATATIAAGSTSVLVRTPVIDDALDEASETFTLTATRTAGTTTNGAATGSATIVDNDPLPALSIDDVTVNEAAGTATFTVTLSAASGRAVTVGYATSNGTATGGADYTSVTGTLNFPAGTLTRTITVPILNDTVFEGSEAFSVVLSTPVNATIADDTGIGTIKDDGTGGGGGDNDTPSLSVSNVTVTEGTNTHAVFTVGLSNLSTTPVSVSLALANGTATGGGVDFGAALEVSTDGGATWLAGATATIAAGQTSVLVRTPITDDVLDEAAETFTLTATRTAGATTNASAVGTATISDNDAAPSLTINDVTVNEGAGTATFTVTLSPVSGQGVSVNYATSSGTATSGADFTSTTGVLNFAAGVTSQTITVPIANDALYEGSESFSVVLGGAVNATIADATGIGTIFDDGTGPGGSDNDLPILAVSNPSVTEGIDGFAVFTVSLSNASTSATTVNLALANVTATGGGVDFGTAGAGNLQVSTDGGASWADAASATFAAGSTSLLVRTPIANDAISEPNETFTLTATTSAGSTRNASATGTATIADDDGLPTITIDDVTVNEAAGVATFTVRLTAVSALTISVDYTTANGAATAGADFTATAGTLSFAPGVTSQTVTVPILNDAIFENSESYSVLLSNEVNAVIADGTGVGTILDNGSGPGGSDNDTPALSVSNVAVTEGTDAFAIFAVNLSNLSTTPVSVNLALANGTASGAGTDFGTGGAGNLQVSTDGGATWADANSATITAGSAGVLVRTPIVDDALDEAAESFTLTATRIAGTTSNVSATGTATITDDDPQPSFTIDDVTVNEGAGTATFTVTLSAASGQPVSIGYATASGTATSGADFTATSGTLNFGPGVTSETVTVPILNDAIFEGGESFTVVLGAAVNATIADGTGVGTILDDGTGGGGSDDDTPTLSVSNVTATEGTDPYAIFAVSLSNLSTTPVSFDLAFADGSASGGGVDYGAGGAGNLEVSTDGGATWADATGATIAAGSTSVLVRTPVVDDAFNEASEDFTLTATVTAGATTNGSAIGTGTIGDDDGLPGLSIDDVTVNEGAGTATFTVRLNVASGLPVTVAYATSNGTATAGADYTASSGALLFNPGETAQTITVPILNDAIFEGSESFNVTLSVPTAAILADPLGVGTVLDNGTGGGGTDDDRPTLSVSNVAVTEGTDSHAIFTVGLSNLSTTAVTVGLALASGSATGAGTDFGSSGAGNIQVSTDGGASWVNATAATIAAGATSVLVRTPITDDLLAENAEDFTLTATVTGGATANASASGTGTIADDDPMPVLTIDDVTVNEGAGTATFTVSLSAPSALGVSVNYTTGDGTATAGADFTSASGTLNFAPGATSQTVTVPILNDALFEQSESFDVLLSGAVNAGIADDTGIGTILDDGTGPGGGDNDTPTLSVSNVTVTEGADPHAIFAVNLSRLSTTPVSVSLALVDGAATGGGTDFGAGLEVSTDGGASWTPAASATIAAGSAGVLVRTPITDDAIDEFSEDFTLVANVTSGVTTNAAASGIATILDNDPTPSLSIDDVTVNEAAGTATFTVTLSAPSGLAVTVAYATSNGTASAAADFTAVGGVLNFGPGVTSQTVTVSIVNDTIFEQSEAFNVTLSSPTNATIADATGVGTILDDGTGPGGSDDDTPTISVSNVTVTEGADPYAIFAVNLSNASTTPVSVSLALADGTALGGGTDYGAGLEVSTDGGASWLPAATATIAAGQTSVLVRTPITDDTVNEAAETFTLTATRTAGTTTNASATGGATINDDDPLPTLTIDDIVVNEGIGTATFTVTLSATSEQPISVDFATGDGTALAGLDYVAATGTLNFAAGSLVQTVTIPIAIFNDGIFENSEDFTVLLSNAVNATIADNSGTATILDAGNGPGGSDDDTPSISVSNAVATEGTDSHAIFAVNLSNPSTTPVTVSLALADGGATGGGTDFGPALEVSTDGGASWVASNSATFAPLATSLLVRTPIVDDALNESAESFTMTATRTAGITVNASASGTGTILDDDPQPSFTIDDVTVNEGAGTATFTVTLSAISGQEVSVNFATADGAATAPADYTGATGTLIFAAGVTTQTITVPIANDGTYEGSETFNVLLAAPANATIADAMGVGTIVDDGTGPGGSDNDIPSVSISSVVVTEGTDTHAIFTASLSNPSTTAVTLSLALVDGTATGGGTDFGPGLEVSTDGGATWTPAAAVTFAPGSTTVLVRTPIIDDALNEGGEDFQLTGTVTAGTTANPATTGTGTIGDNDGPPALSIDDVTVNEGAGTATFTISLSAISGLPVTVDFTTSDAVAVAGLDYTSQAGTLTFAPGVTSQTVTVAVLNDSIFEQSEVYLVVLSNPTNSLIADGTGIGTILDDGTGGGGSDDDRPTLSVSDVSVTEGTDPYAIMAVSLSNPSTTPVDLSLALVNGTATGGGVDFGAGLEVSTDGGTSWLPAVTATIAAGQTSVLVRTPITDDASSEPLESFTLTATVTSGTTLNPSASGTATIADDDAPPELSIGDVVVNEAAGTATFTVSLSVPSGLPISVNYTTVNGSAVAGRDFTAASGLLNFAPGVLSQTVTVSVLDDALFENTEDFSVVLSGAVNAAIADDTGVATILDDDLRRIDLTLVSTSEAGTSGGDVAVGEVVTYEMQLELAEGANAGVTLWDGLPAGLQFLPNAPVIVGFTGVDTSITGFAAGSYTNATADAMISASPTANVDVYGDGTHVYFRLGALTNNDGDADREFVTLQFSAIVTNTLANQSGTLHDNRFAPMIDTDGNGSSGFVTIDRDGDNLAGGTEVATDPLNDGSGIPAISFNVNTLVAEPILVLDKQITSAPPAIKAGDTIVYTVTLTHGAGSAATAWEATLADAVPAGLRLTAIDGVTLAGGAQEQSAAAIGGGGTTLGGVWDIPVGGSVTVVYRAVVTSDAVLGSSLNNLADLTWSTLSGSSADERGSGDGMLGGGGLNDYELQQSANAPIDNGAGEFTLDKQVVGDALAEIGERLTYQLTLTVADGIINSISLNDLIPAGFTLVNGSAQLTAGAGVTVTGANFTYAANQLTLDIAQLQSAVDGAQNTLTITYDVDVLDTAGNTSGTLQTNVVSGTYPALGVTVTAAEDVTVAEPVLDIQKTVDDATPHLGQTVTYTLVVSHNGASTAGAYDLTLDDPLPAGVSLNAASIQLASAPPGTVITSNTSTDGGALQLGLNQLAPGESVTITFTATVTTDPAVIGGAFGGGDDTLSSTVALSYDSQPGSNPEERAYSGSASNTLTVVGAELAVTIDDGQLVATAGSQLTYAITVTNNGTDAAANVVVSDTLPADGTFNAGLSTPGASLVAGKVIYNLASLAVGATDTFIVVVDLADPTSAGLEAVTSVVDVTHSEADLALLDNTAADTDTLLSAPDYQITVTDNRTSARPGETVDYVITVRNVGNQDGTGVIVNDVFATGIFAAVTANNGGVVDLNNGTVSWNVGALAAGDSVTLTLRGTLLSTFATIPVPLGTLPGAVPDNDAIAHTVDVADDGLGGADPTPADNTASDLDDLQPVPELRITTTDNVTLAKPGQTLIYTIVATNAGAQDSNGMIVTDTLPDGVKLVGVSSSAPALSGTPVIAGQTITWTFIGTVPAGTSVTFTVVARVEMNVAAGIELVNRATIADDGFYGPDAVTLSDNAATDTDTTPQATPAPPTRPPAAPPVVAPPAPFIFAFDTFHDFAEEGRAQFGGPLPTTSPIDLAPAAILPLVPIYSGTAEPGATLVIALFNSRGEQIGSQTVIADSGGNWLATFPSTQTRDLPSTVEISAFSAPYARGESAAGNLRTYFSPALNPGHFFFQGIGGDSLGDEEAPLLGGLGLENPLQLGNVKYGCELLSTQAAASGY